ncbi:MAG TPA: hypothetical protein VMH27_16260 [Puia sp.]|nr:hypothetical protein [Puia sp.]
MKTTLAGIVLVISLAAFTAFTALKDKEKEPSGITLAINKGIPLLQRSSHEFLENAVSCHSCHGQDLSAVAFTMAERKGFVIDQKILQEAKDSIYNNLKAEGAKGFLVENDESRPLEIRAGYDLWAFSALGCQPDKWIELLALDMLHRQRNDGSWASPSARPPLEYYSFSTTALAVKGIQVYVPGNYKEQLEKKVQKARNWLTNAIPLENEEKVFQLLGLIWSNADKEFIEGQAAKLLQEQREDGGWAQLKTLPTDAYATGQALYALNQSGKLKSDDPAYQKGVSFLLKTQFEDGSWEVQSRSFPTVPYVYSGFPHGKNQFISAAATNWAIMALILAAKGQY